MRDVLARLSRDDRGLSTAEYAVGTVAVAGLGGILIKLLSSDAVRNLVWQVIQTAFSFVVGG
jgi:Flp pilus assembly pilin Flp